MATPTAHRLALIAFAFGALVYGPGNALIGHHEHTPAHLHHHGAATGNAAAGPWDVPAHCLFCLDGVAPQPTALIAAITVERPHQCVEAPATSKRLHAYLRGVRPPARAPPSAMS